MGIDQQWVWWNIFLCWVVGMAMDNKQLLVARKNHTPTTPSDRSAQHCNWGEQGHLHPGRTICQAHSQLPGRFAQKPKISNFFLCSKHSQDTLSFHIPWDISAISASEKISKLLRGTCPPTQAGIVFRFCSSCFSFFFIFWSPKLSILLIGILDVWGSTVVGMMIPTNWKHQQQEAIVSPPWVGFAMRPRPGIWEYLRVNVDELEVEELSVSEYLGFKERLVDGSTWASVSLSLCVLLFFSKTSISPPSLSLSLCVCVALLFIEILISKTPISLSFSLCMMLFFFKGILISKTRLQ